jgi:hypothetical protein
MFSPEIWDIIEGLPNELQSKHFTIRYGDRNPRNGPGLGVHGVRDRVLILTYLQALENLYRTMTAPPWNWPEPITDDGKKIRVFVCDEDPTTYHDDEQYPCIVLPSRSDEPTTHAELLRAAAEAVHEGTHVFNFGKRPHYETSSNPWIWFDEGMAVLMETLVAAGNPDYFRFLRNWIDVPETPLDESEEKYQSGIFVGYLHRRLGADFVRRVWLDSDEGEGPIKALERLAEENGITFVSPEPSVKDIFASGYCVDPFFMWDHRSDHLAPDIFYRFGERAIAQSFSLNTKSACEVDQDSLNHLSCRYYKFRLVQPTKKVHVEMQVDDPANNKLKCQVVIVDAENQPLRIVTLDKAPRSLLANRYQLSATIQLTDDRNDHLMLVVTNCGTITSAENDEDEHDDDKYYSLKVRAY